MSSFPINRMHEAVIKPRYLVHHKGDQPLIIPGDLTNLFAGKMTVKERFVDSPETKTDIYEYGRSDVSCIMRSTTFSSGEKLYSANFLTSQVGAEFSATYAYLEARRRKLGITALISSHLLDIHIPGHSTEFSVDLEPLKADRTELWPLRNQTAVLLTTSDTDFYDKIPQYESGLATLLNNEERASKIIKHLYGGDRQEVRQAIDSAMESFSVDGPDYAQKVARYVMSLLG